MTKDPELHQWIITVDYVYESDINKDSTREYIDKTFGERDDTGTVGPGKFKIGVPLPYPFKMYDDDGNLYYDGMSSHPDVFAPLDDFGMPNAGCTEIHYRNKDGEFERL